MLHDLRYAIRMLGANPGFTLVAAATLALGIGATTAIFSVTDTVLLRPAPFPGLERLAVVWETDRNTGTFREPASLPDFLDFRQRSTQARELAAFTGVEVNYTPDQGDPIRVQALAISDRFLPLLGVEPIAGRAFTPEETRRGGGRVVLVSERFWTRQLARDPAALGRRLTLDEQPYVVAGIVPADAEFGLFQILKAADYSRSFADRGARASVDVWLPLQEDPESLPRSTHPIFVIARLNGDIAPAQEEFAAIARDLEAAYPENDGRGVHLEALEAVVFGPVRAPLLVLLAAVGLLLFVACANVANLLLARAAARRREIGVRQALGAGGWPLVRQFVIEGLVLTLVAAGLGVGLAVGGVAVLVAMAPQEIPRIADAAVDLRILATALGASVVAGIGVGLVPLVQARRVEVDRVLRSDGSRSVAGARGTLRTALVLATFALAVVLLTGATLLIRSFNNVLQVDPGFRAEGVLKAEYQLPPSRYPVDFRRWPDFREMHAFTRGLLDKVRTIPGVAAAAIAGNHPLDPGFTNSFLVVGREAEAQTWPEISVRRVTHEYFSVMQIPLLRGRLLQAGDTTTGAPVIVINDAAARRFFDGRDPLGQQMQFWGARRRIVGVVGNERFHGLTDAAPPAVYAPLPQAPSANGAGVLLVRTTGDPSALAASVRAAIRQQDPGLAVFGLEPMVDTIGRSVAERRFTTTVLGVLATAALLLAATGIYGVLSYLVSQRTREIAIRVALGARPSLVRAQVVKEGMGLAFAGAGLGLAGAFALTRALRSLLFGVTPTDATTFVLVPVFLGVVALAAVYMPARRATAVDPVAALRD